jgi:Mature-T-Cell Proliferation I type
MFKKRQTQTSSPVDEKDPAEKSCKKHACEIQRCLSRNNFQQSKCALEIEAWESCAHRVRATLHQERSEGPDCETKIDAPAEHTGSFSRD